MSHTRYPADASHQFGPYRLDAFDDVVFEGDRIVPCGIQACRVLRVLVQRPQQDLCWDDVIKEAWNGISVSDAAFRFQVHSLRRALHDLAKQPRFIKTTRKRRVRFIAPVVRVGPTSSSAAAYEKARHLYHKSSPDDVARAIGYYERVVNLNGDYVADAHAGIAECYVLLSTFAHQTMPAILGMAKARDAANHALALNGEIAEAYFALASIAALHEWDWASAADHFESALKRPCNRLVKPLVRAWYSLCLAARGEATRARHEIDRARGEHPSSFVLAALSGRIAYLARDFDLAISEQDESISLEGNSFVGYMFKGHTLRGMQSLAGALQLFETAAKLSGDNPVCLAEIGHIHGRIGNRDAALGILDRLQCRAAVSFVSSYLFAHVHLGLGDLDLTFKYLEDTYAERGAYLIFLKVEEVYDGLRRDPRFSRLMDRVGYWR